MFDVCTGKVGYCSVGEIQYNHRDFHVRTEGSTFILIEKLVRIDFGRNSMLL